MVDRGGRRGYAREMGRTIIKPSRDEDFYVEWSSIVEAPTMWGTRAEMLGHIEGADAEDRLARVDQYGTSALYGNPRADGYDDADGIIYQQEGILKRSDLKTLCERLEKDENADMSDLLEPFEDDE